MKEIGGLWLKDGKSGKFFSGQVEINDVKYGLLIFKNKYKEGKQPDYKIFEGEVKKQEKKPESPEREPGEEEVPF